ncbi:hypothetical protein SDIAM103S_05818 [Streptomyces diastaticus subsp. diastaticus]
MLPPASRSHASPLKLTDGGSVTSVLSALRACVNPNRGSVRILQLSRFHHIPSRSSQRV